MSDDFLQELALKGFTARMKRISDGLLYDARKLYEELDIGIEPNWHLIFLLLKKEGELPVTQIAQRLGFSHPAIIKIVKKMKAQGYLESFTDAKDSRKQLLRLSEKSIRELPIFEKEWVKVQEAIQEFVDADFLNRLAAVEAALQEKGLLARYKTKQDA